MLRPVRSLRLAAALSGVTLLVGAAAVSLPAAAQETSRYAAPTARDAQPRPDDDPVATSPVDVANPCDRTVVPPPGADGTTCMLPFPSNLYTTGTGENRRLNLPLAGMPKDAAGKPISPLPYSASDGFSPGQMLVVKVPGLDNREAFERTGSVPIEDMGRYDDADAPVVVIDVQTGERHPIWTEIDVNPLEPLAQLQVAHEQTGSPQPPDRPWNTANVNFLIRPAKNFLNGHRYVVGMRALRDKDGNVLEATEGFKQYRDEGPLAAADPRTERYEKDIFPVLEEAGFEREDLYQAWDFSVASDTNIAGRLLHMRNDSFTQLGDTTMADRTVQGEAPPFTVTGISADDAGVRTVTGTFDVPCYINTPKCAPGGEFVYADTDRMEPLQLPGNTTTATFTCKIPRRVYDSPTLEKVRPSLYGHGLLGGQGEVNQGQVKDMIREHGFMYCATDWEGFATKDIATVAQALVDMDRFPAVIDHTQQGELNFLHLARLMIHPQGLASQPEFQVDKGDGSGPQSFIDTTRAYYDGNSQGGIYGGTVMAVAPDVDSGVLGVPGINYSTLLSRSVDFALYSLPIYTTYPSEYERQLLFSVIQILWDRADPNGYVNQLRPGSELPDTHPHRVMYQVAYGDHQVAVVSAEVAARSAGAAVDPTPLEPGRSPDVDLMLGVPEISSYPYRGSAFVYFDTGDFSASNPRGTPAPPTENVPPKLGKDPHEAARQAVCGRILKSDFLRPDSFVGQPCLGAPYFAFDYKGADGGVTGQGWQVQDGDVVPLGQEPAPAGTEEESSPSPSPSGKEKNNGKGHGSDGEPGRPSPSPSPQVAVSRTD